MSAQMVKKFTELVQEAATTSLEVQRLSQSGLTGLEIEAQFALNSIALPIACSTLPTASLLRRRPRSMTLQPRRSSCSNMPRTARATSCTKPLLRLPGACSL